MKIKKQKAKKSVYPKKLKFQDYENCLEAAQIGRKIKYLEKKIFNVDSYKEDKKEFLKNNKLILKIQRFKNDHKIMR